MKISKFRTSQFPGQIKWKTGGRRPRRIKKAAARIVTFFACCAMILIGSQKVYAVDTWYTNESTDYEAVIDDQADLLTGSEEEEVCIEMEPITAYGNVAFVSIEENDYYSAASFAMYYYRDQFGYESGTLFLIDMDTREIYIYSYGTVYNTITDTKADTITDNVYKLASNGDYAECAAEAFDQISTLLDGGRIAQPMKYISNALLAILIALLINFIFILRVCRVRGRGSSHLIGGADANISYNNPQAQFTHQTRIYSPRESDSGGGGGGGGSGGGGGGGGGHSF